MTETGYAFLLLAGCWPLCRAWRACRGTSLEPALYWLAAAWAGWGLYLFAGDPDRPGWEPFRFLALALTGCPVVAVLGARRPYVSAWNFVVLGLLCILLLPLVEILVLGSRTLDALRLYFLAATLAIGVLNYLPTRLALFSLWSGFALALLFVTLALPEETLFYPPALVSHLGILLSPWVATLCFLDRKEDRSEFDRLWLTFRDRYGLVWGQRVREQFNRSAHHAGWKARLSWFGLQGEEAAKEMLETLQALLKRFLGPEEKK